MTVKDCIAIAGIPMQGGSALLVDHVPTQDATIVRRALDAGASIVGVTTMDDLALAASGDSGIAGPVLSPVAPDRVAGGSSAGAAASLYLDGVDVALGTDTGGSSRVPAAWCGTLGIKPSYGRVPYTGAIGIDQLFDHIGVMARSVRPIAALLDVISGHDESDPRQHMGLPRTTGLRAIEAAPADLAGWTVGLVREGWLDIDPSVEAALRATLGSLAKLGASCREVQIPEHLDAGAVMFAMLSDGFGALLRSGGSGYQWEGEYWPEIAHPLSQGYAHNSAHLSPQAKVGLLLGEHLRQTQSGAAYGRAANRRGPIRKAYDRALEHVDLLIMPTTPNLAHRASERVSLEDRVRRSWAMLANTTPTNITGHPAISLPVGMADGVPVGLMAVAPHGADERLLSFATVLERELGWQKP